MPRSHAYITLDWDLYVEEQKGGDPNANFDRFYWEQTVRDQLGEEGWDANLHFCYNALGDPNDPFFLPIPQRGRYVIVNAFDTNWEPHWEGLDLVLTDIVANILPGDDDDTCRRILGVDVD